MTKTLLHLFSAAFLTTATLTASFAQDTLFTENFENFTSAAFTLNTSDVSSNPIGYNMWVINNAYAGGTGAVTCMGIPFTFTVPATPSQPNGIFNSPSGWYMHLNSVVALAAGVNNSCFQTADGLCFMTENYFAAMNTDINTSNYDSVSVNFWWLCSGSNNNYGEIYYSTDGGANWTQASVPLTKYYNQSTWTNINVSLPAFAHQPTLRFGFRFVNNTSLNATDPAFAVDDISITATSTTGIHNPTISLPQLTINPTLASEQISICNAGMNAVILDMSGKTVMKVSSDKQCIQADISQLAQGVYTVRTAEGNVKRFLKK
ncbi:MAG: T9SS type A sorting domain-containing protein [Bacteroidetes bacterium]|nr:T9SS type A sorting domain-containing protein [Bacteroidota bacterium]